MWEKSVMKFADNWLIEKEKILNIFDLSKMIDFKNEKQLDADTYDKLDI